MSGSIKRIDARTLKAALHDGLEIALLDAREEQTFGERHILMAVVHAVGTHRGAGRRHGAATPDTRCVV